MNTYTEPDITNKDVSEAADFKRRLVDQIKQRMTKLGITKQSQLVIGMGVSRMTVSTLLNPNNLAEPAPATQHALCQALGWTAMSIDYIKRGDDPKILTIKPIDDNSADVVKQLDQRITHMQLQLGNLEDSYEKTNRAMSEITASINELSDHLVELIEAQTLRRVADKRQNRRN